MARGLRRYERVKYEKVEYMMDKNTTCVRTLAWGTVTTIFESAFQPCREVYVKWDDNRLGVAGQVLPETALSRLFL